MGFAQENLMVNIQILGTSLVVQCLGLCVSNAWGTGSVPGLGTKMGMGSVPGLGTIHMLHSAAKKSF